MFSARSPSEVKDLALMKQSRAALSLSRLLHLVIALAGWNQLGNLSICEHYIVTVKLEGASSSPNSPKQTCKLNLEAAERLLLLWGSRSRHLPQLD